MKSRAGTYRNGNVLVRICTALNCGLEDIMELVPDETARDTN